MEENRLLELIAKKVSGTLESGEQLELERFIAESPDNQSTYDSLLENWNKAANYKLSIDPQTAQSWNRFQLKTKSSSVRILPVMLRIAALLVIAVGIGFYFFNPNKTEVARTTGPLEKKEITLPDGSKVLLNENSSITYTTDFNDATRPVAFKGEAFFNITRNESKPFVINVGTAAVEVLGTSFDVSAYPLAPVVSVSVSTGKVAFKNPKNGEQILLEKGMYGQLDLLKGELTTVAEMSNIDFWRTGQLRFDDVKLSSVVSDIQRCFKTNIDFDASKLGDCKFTGSFQSPTVEEVLEIISATMNLTFTPKGQQGFVLEGNGCH